MKVPLRLNNRSRVKGDFYARICERLRGKFPESTRFFVTISIRPYITIGISTKLLDVWLFQSS
jgi:hypothetical protein